MSVVQSNRRVGGWLSQVYEDDYHVQRDDGSMSRYFENYDEAEVYLQHLQAMDDRERLISEQKRAADETASLRREIERRNKQEEERLKFRPPAPPSRSPYPSMPTPQQIEAQRRAQEELARQKRIDDARAHAQMQELQRKDEENAAKRELYVGKAHSVKASFERNGVLSDEEAQIFSICIENKYYGFEDDNLIVQGVGRYIVSSGNDFWSGIYFFYKANDRLLRRIMTESFASMPDGVRIGAIRDSFNVFCQNAVSILSWLACGFLNHDELTEDRAKKLGKKIVQSNIGDFLRQAMVFNNEIEKVKFINLALSHSHTDFMQGITSLQDRYSSYQGYKSRLQRQWGLKELLEKIVSKTKTKISCSPCVEDDDVAVYGDLVTKYNSAVLSLPDYAEFKEIWSRYSLLMESIPDFIASVKTEWNRQINPYFDYSQFSVDCPLLPLELFVERMSMVCKYLGRLTSYYLFLEKKKRNNGFFSESRKKAKIALRGNKKVFYRNVMKPKSDEPTKDEIERFLRDYFSIDSDVLNTASLSKLYKSFKDNL